MDAIDRVLQEQKLGHRVTLCRDCYGNHWADSRVGWMRPQQDKIELTREQYEWLRFELRRQTRASGRSGMTGVLNELAALLGLRAWQA